MFEAIVHFSGPLSTWSGKPHPREILARRRSRWKWLAMARAQAVLAQVDSGRCGYVILKGDEIVHVQSARDPESNPLPGEPLHEMMR